MSKPINLTEIARRVGVSKTTVSRTISNTGRISQKTRDKIHKAMKETGCLPSRVARRLRNSGKCHLIGLIVPNIQNSFFADLARGVEDVAYSSDYAVLLCNYDEDPVKEQFYLNVMLSESVDGVIIPPISDSDPAVLEFIKTGIPVVSVDRSITNSDMDKVQLDNRFGAFEATSYLIKKGHTRIGIISGPINSSTGRERLEGYLNALENAKIPQQPELICYGDFKEESGRHITKQLLSMRPPPTAIFAANGSMAIGMLEAINTLKLQIPSQIAVANFDDLPLAAVFNPQLTVVRQPAYQIGSEAASLLLKRIENPSRPTVNVTLKPELVIRNSS